MTGSLLLGNEFSPHITSLGNALYFTGETVTTLGFGDILPVTLTAKMFLHGYVCRDSGHWRKYIEQEQILIAAGIKIP